MKTIKETAMMEMATKETAKVETIQETEIQKIQLNELHTIKYLEMLRKTTYKGKKVVFILPNGREY